MVRVVGLEPTRPFEHKILSLARLPISPHPHNKYREILGKQTVLIAALLRLIKPEFQENMSALHCREPIDMTGNIYEAAYNQSHSGT